MDVHIPASGLERSPEEPRGRLGRVAVTLTAGGREYAVSDLWEGGFSLERGGPQPGRGRVDLFDGPRHLFHALVYQTGQTADRTIYAFKHARAAGLDQPRDFAVD